MLPSDDHSVEGLKFALRAGRFFLRFALCPPYERNAQTPNACATVGVVATLPRLGHLHHPHAPLLQSQHRVLGSDNCEDDITIQLLLTATVTMVATVYLADRKCE